MSTGDGVPIGIRGAVQRLCHLHGMVGIWHEAVRDTLTHQSAYAVTVRTVWRIVYGR